MKHTVIRIHYENESGFVMGYSGAYIDMRHLKEIFTRYNIRRDNIANMFIDGYMASEKRLDNLFHIIEHTKLPVREEEDNMKNGKRPTKAHKEVMAAANLDPREWLVVKNLPHKLEVVSKETGEIKELAV
ncbi:DUF6906 family protein [Priestia megaterium]|uniref:DUF6906 family protein n=1 Tax=Priestia megaterium TaxID=1404 RepID=UPI00406BB006